MESQPTTGQQEKQTALPGKSPATIVANKDTTKNAARQNQKPKCRAQGQRSQKRQPSPRTTLGRRCQKRQQEQASSSRCWVEGTWNRHGTAQSTAEQAPSFGPMKTVNRCFQKTVRRQEHSRSVWRRETPKGGRAWRLSPPII